MRDFPMPGSPEISKTRPLPLCLLPGPDGQVGLLFSADQRRVRRTQRPETVDDFADLMTRQDSIGFCEAF